jgi:predicted dehydrogenase
VHAPVLAEGPETVLAGIWSRNEERGRELAQRHGVPWMARVEELFDRCDAVAFAVPPDVQAELAMQAARAGRALLLEKPIAGDLNGAQRLSDAVGEAGVVTQIVLSWRYSSAVRELIALAPTLDPVGGRGHFISSALLGGPFATPWRLERGALLDLGPHLVDLLAACLGPVMSVRAHGRSTGWCGLLLEHETGAVSEASMCAVAGGRPSSSGVDVHGRDKSAGIDCSTAVGPDVFTVMRAEFADAVRTGRPHLLDVEHGLRLQRVVAEAEAQLG